MEKNLNIKCVLGASTSESKQSKQNQKLENYIFLIKKQLQKIIVESQIPSSTSERQD